MAQPAAHRRRRTRLDIRSEQPRAQAPPTHRTSSSPPDADAPPSARRPTALLEKAVNRDEILALYEWAPGDCFRCAATGVDTTLIADIATPIGTCYPVCACRNCVIDLEQERLRYAERTGGEYVAGLLRRD